jgi:hypothetical protein
MGFTNADLLALKSELTANPLGLTGYLAPSAANDEANANALNLVRTQTATDRLAIPVSEIATAVVRSEWAALAQSDRDLINLYSAGGTVNPKTGNAVRTALLQMFGAATVTRANLTALLTAPDSRVNHLFQLGTLSQGGTVSPSDVANARVAT